MKKYILLLLAACLVILGLSLSQTFHDLLPHTVTGDDHIAEVVHSHHSAKWAPHNQQIVSHIRPKGQAYSQEPGHDASQEVDHAHLESAQDGALDENEEDLDHRSLHLSEVEEEEEPHPHAEEEEELAVGARNPSGAASRANGENLEKTPHVDVVKSKLKKLHHSQPVPVLEMLDRAQRVQEEHSESRGSELGSALESTALSLAADGSSSSDVPISTRSDGPSFRSSQETPRHECTRDTECGGHGGCRHGRCMCTLFYTGPHCQQPIELPLSMLRLPFSNFTSKFEGSMVLNQKKLRNQKAITVHLPGKEHEPDKGFRVLVEGSDLEKLTKLLPAEDPMTGNFFETCAIVGSSGIVLNYEDGKDIDAHDMVFRFNSAPTRGYEKYVGRKTTHRITNTQNWGFRESEEENLLIHFRAKSSVKGLFWNGAQRKPWNLYAFDPDLVEYIAFKLDFMATSGFYGILIAMHRCARVDLYGFQVSTEHGTLYHYYDVCDVPANQDRDSSEYLAVRALAEAGLVNFAEPCIIECHNSKDECARCKASTGFKVVPLPSDSKCDPKRVSRGHQEVPWRRERRDRRSHVGK
eukprot:CAMPEP_0196587768 /NCGR_PEP_ID=MMETSP1081-20130531/58537_1 /TAXON_ID=36882 /ORGANISM="Pyramimonas amylifera, Strain CCMP720" /LENGTH=580 /DNA_ID=CAMNT_0041910043 /DNA_START=261 /DNA_END=2003 /DNA_ORIENTATION=+